MTNTFINKCFLPSIPNGLPIVSRRTVPVWMQLEDFDNAMLGIEERFIPDYGDARPISPYRIVVNNATFGTGPQLENPNEFNLERV